jgi:hypothetical protein
MSLNYWQWGSTVGRPIMFMPEMLSFALMIIRILRLIWWTGRHFRFSASFVLYYLHVLRLWHTEIYILFLIMTYIMDFIYFRWDEWMTCIFSCLTCIRVFMYTWRLSHPYCIIFSLHFICYFYHAFIGGFKKLYIK